MKNKLLLFFLFLFTIVSDQISKFIVAANFDLYETKSILGNVLYLRYIRNPGIAFGLSLGNPRLMLAITFLIIIVLGYVIVKGALFPSNMLGRISMIMVIGGAAGNLIDRVRMLEVIDFVDMGIGTHRWPVYNLADTYITLGMFIMIYLYVFSKDPRDKFFTGSSDSHEQLK